MKIYFIGLSSFLIENDTGYRILVDPFNDAPEWSLGPRFPKEFCGGPMGANIVLMSEPDADHAYSPGDWLEKAPKTKPNSDPFPGLDVRGTVLYEWNGDINIAWHYTVDGLRLAHFADNAHTLTKHQLKELGHPDIVFISPPKVETVDALDVVRGNISVLKPKLVIWAHHLAPIGLPAKRTTRLNFFRDYFKKNASTNKNYKGKDSFIELAHVLENAFLLNGEYSGTELNENSLKIAKALLKPQTRSVLFKCMLAKP